VYQSLVTLEPSVQQQLRGCLSAGVALASMRRYGGWTGEAIASAAIASARDLLDATSQGLFACDKSVFDLCSAFGAFGISGFSEGMTFEGLGAIQWHGIRRSSPLVGRKAELSRLRKALDHASEGQGSLVLIEGEMGMGKTRLCQELLQACVTRSGRVRHFCGLPVILGSGLCNVEQGSKCGIEDAVTALQSSRLAGIDMILVDDFHMITPEGQLELMRVASETSISGRLVIFSGRKGLCRLAPMMATCISLRRLNKVDMKALVRHTLDMPAGKRRKAMEEDILNTAIGVPMFAVEMALQPNVSGVALSLLVAVNARLDKIHLDSSLLSVIARQTPAASMTGIMEILQEDPQLLQLQIARAVESGVLAHASDGTLKFSHPMIRRVIVNSVME
jgi:hypothetical protein